MSSQSNPCLWMGGPRTNTGPDPTTSIFGPPMMAHALNSQTLDSQSAMETRRIHHAGMRSQEREPVCMDKQDTSSSPPLPRRARDLVLVSAKGLSNLLLPSSVSVVPKNMLACRTGCAMSRNGCQRAHKPLCKECCGIPLAPR